MRTINAFIAVLYLSSLPAVACETSSGSKTMALVELYTSEGCSSCPPADRWLSSFVKTNRDKVVALAFHVDYWDYLGWRDKFDSPRYSQRQHDEVAANGGKTVYTPQLLIDGSDYGYWSDSESIMSTVATINRRPAAAQLTLKLDPSANQNWRAELTGSIQHPTHKQQIWIAVFEDGLSSEVRAGENSGARLAHNRVVRSLYGPFLAANDGRIKLTQDIAPITGLNPAQAGVVAFVQDTATQSTLQAVSLGFCPHS